MQQSLRVLPNPYAFIHPEHGPQGACPVDNGGRWGVRRWVGAELDSELTVITEDRESLKGADYRDNRQVTVFKFSLEPVTVPATAYYRDRLRDGDLVPADKEQADKIGQAHCKFLSLEEAKRAGIAAFEAEHGAGAFARFEKSTPKPKRSQEGGDK